MIHFGSGTDLVFQEDCRRFSGYFSGPIHFFFGFGAQVYGIGFPRSNQEAVTGHRSRQKGVIRQKGVKLGGFGATGLGGRWGLTIF